MGVTGVEGALSLGDVLDLLNVCPKGVLALDELQGLPFGVQGLLGSAWSSHSGLDRGVASFLRGCWDLRSGVGVLNRENE